MAPEFLTHVTTDKEGVEPKFYRLQDLFLNYDQLTEEEKANNKFRVRMQIYKVDPSDYREACVAICSEGKTTSCKELTGKAKCQDKNLEQIWQIQFLVKDAASQLNKNFFRVILYSGKDGGCHDFFGREHPPCNLYKN